ncbi:uncharacterized protein LOC127877218 [Dreissena polymorpha]|uniref:uncharacterized protein LOC127877218 n=1 Tax=Dreissena polymorpha TaxID=45954 RepID=UPI002263BECC|nr:uncharacterized protein LOC127877218 [Dreissena polymorpha]
MSNLYGKLYLKCIVVDKAFQGVLDARRQERNFHVVYETSLPVSCRNRNDMLKEIELRSTYNIEPLRLLYLLKEQNRAQDFFHNQQGPQRGTLSRRGCFAFQGGRVPKLTVSNYVLDHITCQQSKVII